MADTVLCMDKCICVVQIFFTHGLISHMFICFCTACDV